MSAFFGKIIKLVQLKEVKISDHGYNELSEDGILVKEIIEKIETGKAIEDYPNYPKGPCALILQRDFNENPVHVVWGIPNGFASPAVLVTAYRPDPDEWSADFLRRKNNE